MPDGASGLRVDDESGLMWVADAEYVVTTGLAESAWLPRERALEVVAAVNAGTVENFGYSDWRLPTAEELRYVMDRSGAALDAPAAWMPWQAFTDDIAGVEDAPSGAVYLWLVRGASIVAGFPDVVVLGTNSVRLKNRAEVVSGDVVVNAASGGETLGGAGFELVLDPFAVTPGGFALKADDVRIKNKATAGGDVVYNSLDNKGTIGGAELTPLTLPVFSDLPHFFAQSPAPGALDVTVDPGDAVVLPPGDYGAVFVDEDGTLILTGGTYNVRSVTTGEDAELLFGAMSAVRVEGRVLTGKGTFIGPEDGSGTAIRDLVFYVAGINGSEGALGSTPLAAELGPDNVVGASFYVPNGTLRLAHGTDATGAFLARDVLLEVRSRVTLDSYFFNRPPEPEDDSATVDEGETVSVLDSGETSLLANDTDPNADNLTVTTTPVSGPDHGTLTLAADGTFSYTHDGSETTSDSFVYEVCDDSVPVLCATATVSITVVPVNDPPVAGDDSATVAQGGTVSVLDSGETSLLANDTDVDSTVLTVTTTPVTEPDHGTVTLAADGTFSYTHDDGETTSDSFVYEVCDDGTPVECDTATVSITIVPEFTVTVIKTGLGGGTVTSSPAGIACGATCSASFSGTATVTLSAVANTDSVFAGFSGDADCADGILSADGDKTCFARFDLVGVSATLSVSLAGDGSGRVVSSPAGIDCPGTCSASFPVPTRVTLTPIADDGSEFVGFGGDPDCADGVIGLTGDVSCTATFAAAQATVTVIKTGLGSGTVTSSPAGIDCGSTCSATFTAGETVTLSAVADTGSVFGGFSGDADCADGVLNPTGNVTCFARFDTTAEPVILSVALAGDGSGRVTTEPAGIDCPGTCSAGYPELSRVVLTATADAGSQFVGFSGDADCADGVVRLVGDTSCTATFEALPQTFTLTVLFEGGGSGTVSSSPAGISCDDDCSASFAGGTEVTLFARPTSGTFGGWGGDCSGQAFSTSLTLDADKTCTVTFNP